MAPKIDEYGGWGGLFLYTLLSALISGAVIGAILKWVFDKEVESWRTTRTWQSTALAEVIAPTVMHLARTKTLAERYRVNMLFGEAMLLRDSNSTIRSLLLSKAHLLPPELIPPAQCLLTHYDIWLKRFDLTLAQYKKSHATSDPLPNASFDVGFSELEDAKCGKFPADVSELFQAQFDVLRKELYGLSTVIAANPSFQRTASGSR
jgi:hypothetical protein